jgi:hypothetical protein
VSNFFSANPRFSKRNEPEWQTSCLPVGCYPKPHCPRQFFNFSPLSRFFAENRRDLGLTRSEVAFLAEVFFAADRLRKIPPNRFFVRPPNSWFERPSTKPAEYLWRRLERKIPLLRQVVLNPWLSVDQKISVLKGGR